jgi:hypothetical protein
MTAEAKNRSPPRRPGRKPLDGFEPSKEQREVVSLLAAFGRPYGTICRLIINPVTGKPISPDLLVKVFADEIANAAAKLDLIVATSIASKLKAGDTWALNNYTINRWGWNRDRSVALALPDKPDEPEDDRIEIVLVRPPTKTAT